MCHQLGADVRREYIKRHASGDWGVVGHIDDAKDLTDDQRWCPVLFGKAVENAVAIEMGAGLVESFYPRVFGEGRGTESVRVVTLVSELTLCYAASR
jgi:hypothetical protein